MKWQIQKGSFDDRRLAEFISVEAIRFRDLVVNEIESKKETDVNE